MRLYTFTEIMHSLHITNRQLRKLLVTCRINEHSHPSDGRLKLLTEEEYTRLKAQHDMELDALGLATDAAEAQRALIARVAELEAENRRLKRLGEYQMPPPGESALPPMGERRATTTRHYNVTQSGYQYDEHGVMAKGSVGRLLALHSAYNEDYGRKFLADKMREDERMSVGSVLTWLRGYLSHVGRSADWHECEDAGCACHALSGKI